MCDGRTIQQREELDEILRDKPLIEERANRLKLIQELAAGDIVRSHR